MTAPEPLVPADVDLRDFAFMPLDVLRLRDSGLAAKASGDEFRAAVLLWCAAWHQVPAASLPDDDIELSSLAGYGRVVKEWRRVRNGALHGWVKCSDGRLYHPTVAEKARESWKSKLEQRWRTEAARVKKHNQRHQLTDELALVMPDFDEWMSLGCPQGQTLNVPRDKPTPSQGQGREIDSKGQGQGQGQGQGIKEIQTAGGLHPPVDDGPSAIDRPPLVLVPPSPELPDCPHAELIGLYAKHLPQLRQPMRWDGDRAEAMRTRWRECSRPTAFGDGYATKADGLAFWDRFFAFVASTPKLANGITSREGGQERVWKPSLDWLVNRSNFTKVIEGAFA
jgi:hypothetical protein